ncbi:MAG: hypothetical protein RIA69_09515 [Cyclobacteriaceae bacterium]
MMNLLVVKPTMKLTAIRFSLISLLTISSCGDKCDGGCEDIPVEKIFTLVNDLDENALVTFYGNTSRSNNLALQTSVRAHSNIIIYDTGDQAIGALSSPPFGADIGYDSVTIEIASLGKSIYLDGACSGNPNPLCESGYNLIDALNENRNPLEILEFVIN